MYDGTYVLLYLLWSLLLHFLCCGFQEHADNEAVTNDVGGQALVENIAHKLFVWADGEDRAARFNK